MKVLKSVMMTVLVLIPLSAYTLSGSEILDKIEKTLTAPKDSFSKNTMILKKSGDKQGETRVLYVWTSGKKKRVIKFAKPAGVRGIALLVKDDNDMVLYLPSMRKYRRIQGDMKSQSFQGTDFSYDEMGSYEYTDDYNAKVKSENEKQYVLVLKRKKGSDKKYDKIVMTVDKNIFMPVKIIFYQNGVIKKKMLIEKIEKKQGYQVPVKILMIDVSKNHETLMEVNDIKFDQGLEAKGVFQRRFLKRHI